MFPVLSEVCLFPRGNLPPGVCGRDVLSMCVWEVGCVCLCVCLSSCVCV